MRDKSAMTNQGAVLKRALGPFEVYPLGLGCMNVSHAYGPPIPRRCAARLLHRALDAGCNFLDTATLYGKGANEALIGAVLGARRSEYVLASKCVLGHDDRGRVLDGRPEAIKRFCDASLQRLKTDAIDLYYLHRLDRAVPIEESVGAMADLLAAGKIRAIGLSEMSAETLRRAHRVHPIAAMQSEYSLWTRNAEIGVLEQCRRQGTAFVAFSPLARGFLADPPVTPQAFAEQDIRRGMPRFSRAHYPDNQALWAQANTLAQAAQMSVSELALVWVLSRAPHIIAIPGTSRIEHFESNHRTAGLTAPAGVLDQLSELFQPHNVAGARYSDAAQADIDTECFAFEGRA